ncbi:MAG: TetR/AcrR family transcriptional regulator [Roseibium sp.]|uniref:TetR/AcrR family transcriptional regulator n=1 Tax=Roseibium sp. TaxID=1936156 RepID=UPI002639DD9E|nr:TetR/AcrR family transcriptional regulator [Roseibium sp.]MCV0423960.1 TetR/AcrR family transcriptional regulator [Roseibium sp.]
MSTDTKSAVLDSAERIARACGFDGFSYADLAEEVGIRKASIHHHFPTKAALAVTLMQRYHKTLDEACTHIVVTEVSGSAQLRAVVDQYRSALDGGKSLCLCVAFSTSRESLPADVITQISRFRTMMITWLKEIFEAGKADGTITLVGDPPMEAAAGLALMEGAQLAARAEETPALFENAMQLLLQRCS